jgi:hypothetical protein
MPLLKPPKRWTTTLAVTGSLGYLTTDPEWMLAERLIGHGAVGKSNPLAKFCIV